MIKSVTSWQKSYIEYDDEKAFTSFVPDNGSNIQHSTDQSPARICHYEWKRHHSWNYRLPFRYEEWPRMSLQGRWTHLLSVLQARRNQGISAEEREHLLRDSHFSSGWQRENRLRRVSGAGRRHQLVPPP